jgi:RHS repeat-associated protein
VTGPVLKQFLYNYDGLGNRTGGSLSSNSTAVVNTANYNDLNELTNISGGGQVRFAGHLSELATVTVGSSSAIVNSRNSNFVAYATLTSGTNTVSIVATDYSTNSSTNRYQVIASAGIPTTLKYDANGNLTNAVTAATTNNYEWDTANRLTKITQISNPAPQLVVEMTYDGMGRRVRITEKTNGVVQSDKRFLWCGTDVSEERDSNGGTVTKRFFGSGQQAAGTNYFFSRDQLGSLREVVDTGGSIRARYDYDPYGSGGKVSGDLDADFGFTGHFMHKPSGLYLTLFRAYDAKLGSWLSRDPLGEGAGLNLFAYSLNNPLNYLDPLGLCFQDWARGAAIGAGTGLAGVAVGAGLVLLAPEAAIGFLMAGVVLAVGGTALGIHDAWEAYENGNESLGDELSGELFGAGLVGLLGGKKFGCKPTGQNHHAISNPVHRALQQHPNLRGAYTARDPRFVTQALDLDAHNGWQTWHRELDAEVATWIRNNQGATQQDFENYLRQRYNQPDLKKKFPNGL